MKKSLTALVTLFMLPLTGAASIVIVASMLAVTALFSPIIIFGNALALAGKLTTKLTNWLFSNDYSQFKTLHLLATLASMTVLTPLCIIPVAVGFAILVPVISALLIPSLAIERAYSIAEQAVNRIFDFFDLNQEETPKDKENKEPLMDHSYRILSEGLGMNLKNTDQKHSSNNTHHNTLFQNIQNNASSNTHSGTVNNNHRKSS